jgi:hypothetical protein
VKSKRSIFSRVLNLLVATSLALVVYVVTYIVNSLNGGYYLKPEMDGNMRYSDGYSTLAIPVAIMWQPYFGHYALGRTDFWGKFYCPAIMLDRKFVHKTRYLTEGESTVFNWMSTLPLSKIHPEFRREIAKQRGSGIIH